MTAKCFISFVGNGNWKRQLNAFAIVLFDALDLEAHEDDTTTLNCKLRKQFKQHK